MTGQKGVVEAGLADVLVLEYFCSDQWESRKWSANHCVNEARPITNTMKKEKAAVSDIAQFLNSSRHAVTIEYALIA